MSRKTENRQLRHKVECLTKSVEELQKDLLNKTHNDGPAIEILDIRERNTGHWSMTAPGAAFMCPVWVRTPMVDICYSGDGGTYSFTKSKKSVGDIGNKHRLVRLCQEDYPRQVSNRLHFTGRFCGLFPAPQKGEA